jgi:mono/diheme cytochrome c family protein
MSQFIRTIALAALFGTATSTAESAENVDLSRQIGEILRQRCASCHGEEKHKGKLRLDTAAAIAEASKRMQLVVAGKPDESVLLQRISLPADDVDVMPPEGDPLPSVQVALFRRWIETGARLSAFDEPARASSSTTEKLPEVSAADPQLLRKLRERGAVVVAIARDSNLLDIGFPENAARITDAELSMVALLGERVWRLDLSRTAVTDKGLLQLAKLNNLTTLHLRGTAVRESALPIIEKLPRLRRLNLVETAVSAVSIDGLARQRPELRLMGARPSLF